MLRFDIAKKGENKDLLSEKKKKKKGTQLVQNQRKVSSEVCHPNC